MTDDEKQIITAARATCNDGLDTLSRAAEMLAQLEGLGDGGDLDRIAMCVADQLVASRTRTLALRDLLDAIEADRL